MSKYALLYNHISNENAMKQREDANKRKHLSFLYVVKNECGTFRMRKTTQAATFNIVWVGDN